MSSDIEPKRDLETSKEMKEELAEETWASQFDLDNLCRLIGTPGLWTPKSKMNKSEMQAFQRFDGKGTAIKFIADIVPLNRFTFNTTDGEDLKMREVLDNVRDGIKDIDYEMGRLNVMNDTAMQIIVPDYDEGFFKPYHAELVMKFYRSLVKGLELTEKKAEK